MPLLEISNLEIFYKKNKLKAVRDVSFSINKGEIYGLVGESGCGKSSLAKAIVNLLQPNRGEIIFNGDLIKNFKKQKLKNYRKSVQMIFQDPYSSLNPRMQVGEALIDVMKVHKIFNNQIDQINYATKLLNSVGLKKEFLNRYPHEFSGGQRQRICIARALTVSPKLIIADEPVSALDVSVQAEILDLIENLRSKSNIAFLFISHDLAVVRNLCDRISVMYNGKIVESGVAKEVIDKPEHYYTKKLVEAVPIF